MKISSQKMNPKRKISKPIMKFQLKEDTTDCNESSSEDEETNYLLENLDDSDEEIVIWDVNPVTKKKTKSKKSYKMTVVDDRVGFKIRLDD